MTAKPSVSTLFGLTTRRCVSNSGPEPVSTALERYFSTSGTGVASKRWQSANTGSSGTVNGVSLTFEGRRGPRMVQSWRSTPLPKRSLQKGD